MYGPGIKESSITIMVIDNDRLINSSIQIVFIGHLLTIIIPKLNTRCYRMLVNNGYSKFNNISIIIR
ncbi:hypothetical protein BH18THE2_BH18THE2_04330 [soil metagenome]